MKSEDGQAGKPIPIALGLYTVREDCERDMPATLAEVASVGYDGIEISGISWDLSGREIRKMLDNVGLKCCGILTIMQGMKGDGLARSIDYATNLGTKNILLSWLFPEERGGSC